MTFISHFVDLSLDAAPWLLLGLLLAGLIKSWVPTPLLSRHLGQPGFGSIFKAALLGAPLPLCSCGVVPVALGLRRNGASKGATVSFLISTPETGADSITVSYALLGPFMAVIRPVAAIVSALSAGLLTGLTEASPRPHQKPETTCRTSECSDSAPIADDCCSTPQPTPTGCCNGTNDSASQKIGLLTGIRYALTDIVDDLAGWLIIGLLLSALVMTYVPHDLLSQWGSGPLAMLVMALVGIPLYICATASTPIAAGLLLAGISPGAVLVFMLAGPATNIATLGVVTQELGKRALAAYLFGVAGISLMFGWLTNRLAAILDIDMQAQLSQSEQLVPSGLALASALVLAALLLASIWRKLHHRLALTPRHGS